MTETNRGRLNSRLGAVVGQGEWFAGGRKLLGRIVDNVEGLQVGFELSIFFTRICVFLTKGSELVRELIVGAAKFIIVRLGGGKLGCEESVFLGQFEVLFLNCGSFGFGKNSSGFGNRY